MILYEKRSPPSSSLCDMKVEPLTATIGAEISGVDLASDLSDAEIAEIRAALLDWKVIFFRDQLDLDRERHIEFGRRFGGLEVHPLTPEDQDEPEIFVLPSEGKMRAPDVWHSDVTWRPEPSLGSILRIVESPPLGGDTLWADMAAAYDLLDDRTRDKVDKLVGLHDYARVFGRHLSSEQQEKMRAKHPTVEHPVVRTHPETGRPTIYVNRAFTCGIKDMDEAEARPLLAELERTATVPDVQCRFRWRPGSVAFWDNRATQHCVSNDFLPHRRVMERVTVVGDRPF
jgi:taurine dioxygenase